jgi:putative inorganic carbon (hco3(-)) transporter
MSLRNPSQSLAFMNDERVNRSLFAFVALVAALGIAGATLILPGKLLILAALSLPLVLFVSKKTEWGLYLLGFMVYTNLSFVLINFNGFPSVAKFFVLSIFILGIRQAIVAKRVPDALTRSLPFLVIFFFVMMLSLIHAVNQEATISKLDDYFKDMIICVTVVLMLQSGVSLKRMIYAILIGGAFICTFSVYQFLTSTFDNNYWGFAQAEMAHIIGETSNWRIGGPVGSPNSFAHLLLLMVPLAFDRFTNEKKILWRAVGAYALGVSVLTIMFTYSRSAFLGLVAMTFFMMVLKPPKFSTLFGFGIAIVFALQFLPASYTDRLTTLTDLLPSFGGEEPTAEVSFRGRESENMVAWMIFHDHPIFGVGVNNYGEYYLQYSSQLGVDGRRAERTAHNRYLQILAEQGFVGLTAFLALVGAIAFNMWKARNMFKQNGLGEYADIAASATIAFLGYMTIHYFIDDIHPRYFWMMAGIGFALPDVAAFEIARMRQLVFVDTKKILSREEVFGKPVLVPAAGQFVASIEQLNETEPVRIVAVLEELDETVPDRIAAGLELLDETEPFRVTAIEHLDDTQLSRTDVFMEEESETVASRDAETTEPERNQDWKETYKAAYVKRSKSRR